MKRVVVYVEGPSDKAAMEALLKPLLRQRRQQGIAIDFFDAPAGDRKKSLLLKIPHRAVNILCNQPATFVVTMPDLYPRNRGFPHKTYEELANGVLKNFRRAVQRKRIPNNGRLEERFKVFCFKHDLEALVLASRDALRIRLEATSLPITWTLPVENQNHDQPPKRVVEDLFRQHRQRYRDTVDAPLILSGSDYQGLAEACPQCFKPFVEFLSSIKVG